MKKEVIRKVLMSRRFLFGLPLVFAVVVIGSILQIWTHGHFYPDLLFGVVVGTILGYLIAQIVEAVGDALGVD